MRRLPGFVLRESAVPLALAVLLACESPTQPGGYLDPASGEWAAVTAGDGITCALDAAGAAFCWGDIASDTTTEPHAVAAPLRVRGSLRFRAISAGTSHVCALDAVGAAWCWGNNGWGQLGDGSRGVPFVWETSSPVAVAGGLAFTTITAGAAHSCALTATGEAWCWGEDDEGQLGVGGTSPCGPGIPDARTTDAPLRCIRLTPTRVAGAHVFVALSAGAQHTCALDDDGAAWCWGTNFTGQLGDSTIASDCGLTERSRCRSYEPTPVSTTLRFTTIAAGRMHDCAIDRDQRAYCWGAIRGYGSLDSLPSGPSNASAALGLGVLRAGGSATPAPVVGGLSFVAITAGDGRSCGLTVTNQLRCWGDNAFGGLGTGGFDLSPRPTPVRMPAALGAAALGVNDHACAVTTRRRIFCWGGYDFFGELGTGRVGGIGAAANVYPTPAAVVAPRASP